MDDVKHPPGTFCWCELVTSDAEAAKAFYVSLFGWDLSTNPIPGGGSYTMIQQPGGNVGGLYELNAEMKEKGVPPHWASYVSVASAADAASKAKELGAMILRDAFDVMDIGRMAVVRDPTGAVFSLWEPLAHHGTHFVGGKTGSMVWNELATPDAAKAQAFYEKLFGWSTKHDEKLGYTSFSLGDTPAGGMMEIREEWGEVTPQWQVYFGVDDCDAAVAKAKAGGGELLHGPNDIPGVGGFAVLVDPQGVSFSVIRFER